MEIKGIKIKPTFWIGVVCIAGAVPLYNYFYNSGYLGYKVLDIVASLIVAFFGLLLVGFGTKGGKNVSTIVAWSVIALSIAVVCYLFFFKR